LNLNYNFSIAPVELHLFEPFYGTLIFPLYRESYRLLKRLLLHAVVTELQKNDACPWYSLFYVVFRLNYLLLCFKYQLTHIVCG